MSCHRVLGGRHLAIDDLNKGKEHGAKRNRIPGHLVYAFAQKPRAESPLMSMNDGREIDNDF